jgi:hypothetical protein
MRLHESHEEGGFGVSHNTITRSRCLPPRDAPPLCTLKRLHGDLLQQ